MNRDFENNNRPRKNHYADFDEHGNPRTGNTQSLSRYNPEDRRSSNYGGQRENYSQQDRNRVTSDARAYGDYSRGTRYGEGGSTYGGGSSYGTSNYGWSGSEGPRSRDNDRKRSEDVQRGSGDYSSRNYGSFGGDTYSGYMSDDRNTSYRGAGYDDRFKPDYGTTGRENTGYDRGFRTYGHTGYGSTGYDNRDLDRERSAYSSNRDYRNESRDEYRSGEGNRRDEHGQPLGLFNRDRNRNW